MIFSYDLFTYPFMHKKIIQYYNFSSIDLMWQNTDSITNLRWPYRFDDLLRDLLSTLTLENPAAASPLCFSYKIWLL